MSEPSATTSAVDGNLVEILLHRAAAAPDQPAIVQTRRGVDEVVTFRELDRRVASLAASLARRGVRPGDRVLLLLPVSAALYGGLIAALRCGACAMLLDPSAGLEHVRRCCHAAPPTALITTRAGAWLRLASAPLRSIATLALDRSGVEVRSWAARFGGAHDGTAATAVVGGDAPHDAPCPRTHDDPALLTFTSGSTAEPKAVVRSHGLLRAQHAALAEAMGPRAGEAALVTLPVFVLTHLAAGVTAVVADCDLRRPGFVDARPVLRQVARWRPRSVVASPSFLVRLVDAATPGELESFGRAFTGGAPVYLDVLDRLAHAFAGARVEIVYGSTEAEPIAHLAHDDIDDSMRAESTEGGGAPVGHVVASADVRVIADRWGEPLGPFARAAFDALAVPRGERGEIVVAGPHVVAGYLGGRGDRETKIHVEGRVWHRTGDAGRFDETARLWLLGRCGGAVECSSPKRASRRVYPFEIEFAVRAVMPGVRTALASRADEPVLVVEGRAPLTEEEQRRLDETLAHFGVRQTLRVDRIPLDRRHNAKVDERALRRLIAARSRRASE